MFKRIIVAAAVLSALGTAAAPATADTWVRVAPPAPRMEPVPEPRRGYVWSPGHWEWRRQQHIWVAGTWLRERPGYAYRPPNWVRHDNRWSMEGGRWERGGHDRDHDGVRNGRDHDRDGDGVPNRYDPRPNDPHVR